MESRSLLEEMKSTFLKKQNELTNSSTRSVTDYYSSLVSQPVMVADLVKIVKIIVTGRLDSSMADSFTSITPVYVPVTEELLFELTVLQPDGIKPPRVHRDRDTFLLVLAPGVYRLPLTSVADCLKVLNDFQPKNLLKNENMEQDVQEVFEVMRKMLHLTESAIRPQTKV